MDDDTYEIGYREDGVMWVTASSEVPDAEAAEAYLGRGWRVLKPEFLAPTGAWVNSKDPEWAVCDASAPDARRGWRLIDTGAAVIFGQESGEDVPNPHYGGIVPQVGEATSTTPRPAETERPNDQNLGRDDSRLRPKRRR